MNSCQVTMLEDISKVKEVCVTNRLVLTALTWVSERKIMCNQFLETFHTIGISLPQVTETKTVTIPYHTISYHTIHIYSKKIHNFNLSIRTEKCNLEKKLRELPYRVTT